MPTVRKHYISETDKRQFLKLVAEGKNRSEAGRAVGHTGARFRSLVNSDADFADAYFAAKEQGEAHIVTDLRATLLERAKEHGGLELHRAQILWDDEYRDAHSPRQRVELTGQDGRAMEVIHVEGAADQLRKKLAPVVDFEAARAASAGHRNGDG